MSELMIPESFIRKQMKVILAAARKIPDSKEKQELTQEIVCLLESIIGFAEKEIASLDGSNVSQ